MQGMQKSNDAAELSFLHFCIPAFVHFQGVTSLRSCPIFCRAAAYDAVNRSRAAANAG
jgi:hypothetical protein